MSFTSYIVIIYIKISKIVDCGLERIGDLPNDFVYRALREPSAYTFSKLWSQAVPGTIRFYMGTTGRGQPG